jgi:hypothetical protein
MSERNLTISRAFTKICRYLFRPRLFNFAIFMQFQLVGRKAESLDKPAVVKTGIKLAFSLSEAASPEAVAGSTHQSEPEPRTFYEAVNHVPAKWLFAEFTGIGAAQPVIIDCFGGFPVFLSFVKFFAIVSWFHRIHLLLRFIEKSGCYSKHEAFREW